MKIKKYLKVIVYVCVFLLPHPHVHEMYQYGLVSLICLRSFSHFSVSLYSRTHGQRQTISFICFLKVCCGREGGGGRGEVLLIPLSSPFIF